MTEQEQKDAVWLIGYHARYANLSYDDVRFVPDIWLEDVFDSVSSVLFWDGWHEANDEITHRSLDTLRTSLREAHVLGDKE